MKTLKLIGMSGLCGMFFLVGAPVFATNPPELGGDTGTINTNLKNSTAKVFSDTGPTAPQFIASIIEVLLGVLGVIFLVLLMYGGYLWMTDMGDEKQVGLAKNTIRNAIIGIVIVAAAYAITAFVIDKILGAAKIG